MNPGVRINEQADEIPKEIKLAIKALDDETRLAIIVLLMRNTKMTFTELKKTLELNSSSLSNHLSSLQDGGLITNFLQWNDDSYSYYSVTDMARELLKSLFDVIVRVPSISTQQIIDESHIWGSLSADNQYKWKKLTAGGILLLEEGVFKGFNEKSYLPTGNYSKKNLVEWK
jgi:DNA-binding transcriptional ArsR family regulator